MDECWSWFAALACPLPGALLLGAELGSALKRKREQEGLGRGKRVCFGRMELTVERLGVEGSLELQTLERDHTRNVTW